jgi:hypothetical protein
MTGPPESNSAASTMFSSTALVSGSACPTTARSKRRAITPNWSPATMAMNRRGKADDDNSRGDRPGPVPRIDNLWSRY